MEHDKGQPSRRSARVEQRRRRLVSRSPTPRTKTTRRRCSVSCHSPKRRSPSSSPELVYIRTSPDTAPSHNTTAKEKQAKPVPSSSSSSSSSSSKSISGSSTQRSVEGHIYTSNVVDAYDHGGYWYDEPMVTHVPEDKVAQLQAVPYSESIRIITIGGNRLRIEGDRKKEGYEYPSPPLYLDISLYKMSIKLGWLVAHGRERFVRRILCIVLEALLEHGRCKPGTLISLDACYMPGYVSSEARIGRNQSGLLDMYFKLGFKVDRHLNSGRVIKKFKRAWVERRRTLKTTQSEISRYMTMMDCSDAPAITLSTTVGEVLQRCASTPNLRVPHDDVLYMIMHDPIHEAVQRLTRVMDEQPHQEL